MPENFALRNICEDDLICSIRGFRLGLTSLHYNTEMLRLNELMLPSARYIHI